MEALIQAIDRNILKVVYRERKNTNQERRSFQKQKQTGRRHVRSVPGRQKENLYFRQRKESLQGRQRSN